LVDCAGSGADDSSVDGAGTDVDDSVDCAGSAANNSVDGAGTDGEDSVDCADSDADDSVDCAGFGADDFVDGTSPGSVEMTLLTDPDDSALHTINIIIFNNIFKIMFIQCADEEIKLHLLYTVPSKQCLPVLVLTSWSVCCFSSRKFVLLPAVFIHWP